jgi:hypothetical protein
MNYLLKTHLWYRAIQNVYTQVDTSELLGSEILQARVSNSVSFYVCMCQRLSAHLRLVRSHTCTSVCAVAELQCNFWAGQTFSRARFSLELTALAGRPSKKYKGTPKSWAGHGPGRPLAPPLAVNFLNLLHLSVCACLCVDIFIPSTLPRRLVQLCLSLSVHTNRLQVCVQFISWRLTDPKQDLWWALLANLHTWII